MSVQGTVESGTAVSGGTTSEKTIRGTVFAGQNIQASVRASGAVNGSPGASSSMVGRVDQFVDFKEALIGMMGSVPGGIIAAVLNTSRRIPLYLAGDLSDDNYIRTSGEAMEFISATTNGTTRQAVSPYGGKLYWQSNPDTGARTSDGYPMKDGRRLVITTEETNWPVMVYDYTEHVKTSVHFEMVGDHYLPVWTFGTGDGDDKNRGWLVKEFDALRLMYRTTGGKDLGLLMHNNGFMDAYGLRRTEFLDFSELPFGKFYEVVEGLDKEFAYTVERDTQGRPVKIIDDEDGHELTVRWW